MNLKRRYLPLVLTLITATTALAHSGVQNAAVKARMAGMTAIGDNMKVLGAMAKGQTAFDAQAAQSAAAAIASHAARTPDLFMARESDPKSEARAEIWDNFDDFVAKSKTLENLASDLSGSLRAAADLGPAMGALGGACKSCHSAYRE